jgi:aquaporin NIP
LRRIAAEFLGTFALVFAGTGAIIVNDVSGGALSHLGVALTFGLVVLAMIHAVGDVSGAHLNPPSRSGLSPPGVCPREPRRRTSRASLPARLRPASCYGC